MIPFRHISSPDSPAHILRSLAMIGRPGRAEALKALAGRSACPLPLRDIGLRSKDPSAIIPRPRAVTAALVRRSLEPLIARRAPRTALQGAARSAGHPTLTRTEIDGLVREAIATFLRTRRRLDCHVRPAAHASMYSPSTRLHII